MCPLRGFLEHARYTIGVALEFSLCISFHFFAALCNCTAARASRPPPNRVLRRLFVALRC